jgi:hypothetical protein
MTFHEFQATRTECNDLGKAMREETLMGVQGFIYADACWIERVAAEEYTTILGRSDSGSAGLARLERMLYDEVIGDE